MNEALSAAVVITNNSNLNCRNTPLHSSKEILVVMGSITTCDPGSIYTTLQVR